MVTRNFGIAGPWQSSKVDTERTKRSGAFVPSLDGGADTDVPIRHDVVGRIQRPFNPRNCDRRTPCARVAGVIVHQVPPLTSLNKGRCSPVTPLILTSFSPSLFPPFFSLSDYLSLSLPLSLPFFLPFFLPFCFFLFLFCATPFSSSGARKWSKSEALLTSIVRSCYKRDFFAC